MSARIRLWHFSDMAAPLGNVAFGGKTEVEPRGRQISFRFDLGRI
jgi:hypothetical protein